MEVGTFVLRLLIALFLASCHPLGEAVFSATLGDIYDASERSYQPINEGRKLGSYHCSNLRRDYSHYNTSGIYDIFPGPSMSNGAGHFSVFCDMSLGSGDDGWTVIQRRVLPDSTHNDYIGTWNRSWYDYRSGFGDLHGNFWLGLHNIRRILLSPGITTSQSTFDLYIGMKTGHPYTPLERCAYYHDFRIGPEEEDFKLTLGSNDTTEAGTFCGQLNANKTTDQLTPHADNMFSTYDHDKDGHTALNCAASHGGGWWFKNCLNSHLNGEYPYGMQWEGITGNTGELLKTVVMAIKQV